LPNGLCHILAGMLPHKFTEIDEKLLCKMSIIQFDGSKKARTQLPIIGHIVCDDSQKGVLIA
jgi:hypothetical protein